RRNEVLAPAVIAFAYCGYRWATAVALEKDFSSWFWVLPFQRRIRPVSAAAATVGVESQRLSRGLTTGGECSLRSSLTLEKPTAGTAARRDRHGRGGSAHAGTLDDRGLHLPDGGAVCR